MGAKSAKPECPTCIACESCTDNFDCETFWNSEFIARAGASGDAQQNDWRYDYNDALEFVQRDCTHKTGKDTVAHLPFCNMTSDDCTETRTLDGVDATLTSRPHEADCVAALCTQNGSTQFIFGDFEMPECTGGKIHELDTTLQDRKTAYEGKIKEIADLKSSMSSLPAFLNSWESAWHDDKAAAQDSIALEIATCNDVLSGECTVDGSSRQDYSKTTCDEVSGNWTSTQKDLSKKTNLMECEAQVAIQEPARDRARNALYRAYAINAMHVERGVASSDDGIDLTNMCV